MIRALARVVLGLVLPFAGTAHLTFARLDVTVGAGGECTVHRRTLAPSP